MKLWLDDVRPAPEGWVWVKSVAEAKEQILAWANDGEEWTHASLDHDLGADPSAGLLARGSSRDGSGYDLVEWMCDESRLPTEAVTIHSWNSTGARRMAFLLRAHCDVPILVEPAIIG